MRGAVSKCVGGLLLCACTSAPICAQDTSAPRIAFAPVLQIAQSTAADGADDSDADGADQIAAVIVRGNEAIDDAVFQSALTEFFGEEVTQERLAELSNEVAQLAKDEGYAYATSQIISHTNGLGIVEVQLDEGVVERVDIDGYDNSAARAILEKLIGSPVTKSQLERALLLVSDLPAVRLRSAKFKRVDGQGVLAVELSQRSSSFRVSGDNYGSQAFGPVRARASVSASGVLTGSDNVRAAVRVNPVDLEELLFLSAAYQTQIGADGVTVSLSGSVGTTAPGGAFGDIDITGESVRGSAQVTVPVVRSKDVSVWVDGRAGYISIEQDDIAQMLRDDTVVTVEVGLRTQLALGGGDRLRAGVTHVRGIDALGATRLGDTLASRADGDGVFSKLSFWADARLSLNSRLSLFFAMGGQIADRALLGSEELALGGAYRTRGYNFSEVLGDEGIYGLAELRYSVPTGKLPLDRLQLYAFADGGVVSDIGQDFGEGSLFSAGPGVRARMGIFDLELEGGFPLGGSGERSDDGPQVNVRAGVSF